jgi:hypothetical protein
MKEYEKACKRLQSLLERGASDYEIQKARQDVRRLAKVANATKHKKGRVDRDDDWR